MRYQRLKKYGLRAPIIPTLVTVTPIKTLAEVEPASNFLFVNDESRDQFSNERNI